MKEDIAKLKAQLAPILALTKAALKDLASGNGTFWKEAVGELHSQYNQIPIWVFLYEDGDLLKSHAALCDTLRPHMEALAPLQITLIYKAVRGDEAFSSMLSGNDAVFSAGANGRMDLRWYPSSLGTVFTSRDSKRTGLRSPETIGRVAEGMKRSSTEDLAKQKEQLAPTLALSKAALKDLASHNGTFWKEAVGELQSQYNEIVIWVLLYEDSDLVKSHAALCETLRPHMEALAPLQIVLFYEVVRGDEASASKLSGNDAVFSAGANGRMDLHWFPSSLSTVFTSRDSKRTG